MEPLKNVQVVVPPAVSLGSHVTLTCLYDLEHNESLYAVKFYLETEEFYRYVPKEVPAIQIFPITGLDIDVSQILFFLVALLQFGVSFCTPN